MNLNDILVDLSAAHLSLLLPCSCFYAGTAVYGKGTGTARRIINLKVDENFSGRKNGYDSPEKSIRDYAERQGWKDPAVGFLTSASMDSYAFSRLTHESLSIETHLTSGLSNARAPGDRAEYRDVFSGMKTGGTINTIIISNSPLTLTAALEALMLSAGARARVLHEMGVKSRISDAGATGTGTDSTMIFYPEPSPRGPSIEFAGMHTITGELLAGTVIEALRKSLSWYVK